METYLKKRKKAEQTGTITAFSHDLLVYVCQLSLMCSSPKSSPQVDPCGRANIYCTSVPLCLDVIPFLPNSQIAWKIKWDNKYELVN